MTGSSKIVPAFEFSSHVGPGAGRRPYSKRYAAKRLMGQAASRNSVAPWLDRQTRDHGSSIGVRAELVGDDPTVGELTTDLLRHKAPELTTGLPSLL